MEINGGNRSGRRLFASLGFISAFFVHENLGTDIIPMRTPRDWYRDTRLRAWSPIHTNLLLSGPVPWEALKMSTDHRPEHLSNLECASCIDSNLSCQASLFADVVLIPAPRLRYCNSDYWIPPFFRYSNSPLGHSSIAPIPPGSPSSTPRPTSLLRDSERRDRWRDGAFAVSLFEVRGTVSSLVRGFRRGMQGAEHRRR